MFLPNSSSFLCTGPLCPCPGLDLDPHLNLVLFLILGTSIITFIKASRPHQCPTNEFINLQQRLQRLTWISPLLANFDISIKRIWEQTFSHQIIESVKKVDTRYLAWKEISNILVILVSFIKITLDNQIYWHWYYKIIKWLIWSM